MERESFVFYGDWWNAIKNLPKEHFEETVRAILDYGLNGILPKKTSIYVDVVMAFVKPQIDRATDNYIKRCEINRNNARKGGRPHKVVETTVNVWQHPSEEAMKDCHRLLSSCNKDPLGTIENQMEGKNDG